MAKATKPADVRAKTTDELATMLLDLRQASSSICASSGPPASRKARAGSVKCAAISRA